MQHQLSAVSGRILLADADDKQKVSVMSTEAISSFGPEQSRQSAHATQCVRLKCVRLKCVRLLRSRTFHFTMVMYQQGLHSTVGTVGSRSGSSLNSLHCTLG